MEMPLAEVIDRYTINLSDGSDYKLRIWDPVYPNDFLDSAPFIITSEVLFRG